MSRIPHISPLGTPVVLQGEVSHQPVPLASLTSSQYTSGSPPESPSQGWVNRYLVPALLAPIGMFLMGLPDDEEPDVVKTLFFDRPSDKGPPRRRGTLTEKRAARRANVGDTIIEANHRFATALAYPSPPPEPLDATIHEKATIAFECNGSVCEGEVQGGVGLMILHRLTPGRMGEAHSHSIIPVGEMPSNTTYQQKAAIADMIDYLSLQHRDAWNDYQLRSVAHFLREPVFEVRPELSFSDIIAHAAARRVKLFLDEVGRMTFTTVNPAHDWNIKTGDTPLDAIVSAQGILLWHERSAQLNPEQMLAMGHLVIHHQTVLRERRDPHLFFSRILLLSPEELRMVRDRGPFDFFAQDLLGLIKQLEHLAEGTHQAMIYLNARDEIHTALLQSSPDDLKEVYGTYDLEAKFKQDMPAGRGLPLDIHLLNLRARTGGHFSDQVFSSIYQIVGFMNAQIDNVRQALQLPIVTHAPPPLRFVRVEQRREHNLRGIDQYMHTDVIYRFSDWIRNIQILDASPLPPEEIFRLSQLYQQVVINRNARRAIVVFDDEGAIRAIYDTASKGYRKERTSGYLHVLLSTGPDNIILWHDMGRDLTRIQQQAFQEIDEVHRPRRFAYLEQYPLALPFSLTFEEIQLIQHEREHASDALLTRSVLDITDQFPRSGKHQPTVGLSDHGGGFLRLLPESGGPIVMEAMRSGYWINKVKLSGTIPARHRKQLHRAEHRLNEAYLAFQKRVNEYP